MRVQEINIDSVDVVSEPVVSSFFCDGMVCQTTLQDCLECRAVSRCDLFKSKTRM